MARKMYAEDWSARAEAYDEAAEHLNLNWTEDLREREQGKIVTELLRREARKCARIATSAESFARNDS